MEERERKTQELLRTRDHSVQVKKRAVRGTWGAAGKQAMAQNVSMEKVHQFGGAFEMIQQATGGATVCKYTHSEKSLGRQYPVLLAATSFVLLTKEAIASPKSFEVFLQLCMRFSRVECPMRAHVALQEQKVSIEL